MMTDRLNHPDFEPVVFKYVGDPALYEKYIELTVETGFKPVSVRKARLPRKLIQKRYIMIFKNDNQVSIPEFLAKREGLI